MRLAYLPLVCLPLLGCATDPSDDTLDPGGGKSDGVDQTCDDPRYGDGVCQTSIACDVPDVDCFEVFADDDAAAAWFAGMEEQLAAAEHRAPRAVLPTTDPRYQRARELADRGWAAFASVRPVGELAGMRPAVVVIEDPSVNAFVMPLDLTASKAAFSIQVQTGLLDVDATDDGRLGVMMHELQHAIGLHVIAGVRDAMRRFYVAPGGPEPVGAFQPDDARPRAAWTAWVERSNEVGAWSDPELRGLPLTGQLKTILDQAVRLADPDQSAACAPARAAVSALGAELLGHHSAIDDTIAVPKGFGLRVDAALARLRDDCMGELELDFFDVLATIANVPASEIEAHTPPEDVALVKGKHVVDAIAAVTIERRAAMRDLEARFEADTGHPWTALRFFSMEESADDTSIPVLRAAGLDPAGLAGFFLPAFLGDEAAACEARIADGTTPYGVRLDDDHHGNCFRVAHIRQLATSGGAEQAARVVTPPATTTAIRPARRGWLPPRPQDVIVY